MFLKYVKYMFFVKSTLKRGESYVEFVPPSKHSIAYQPCPIHTLTLFQTMDGFQVESSDANK